MITKEYNITEVTFCPPNDWPGDLKSAIGEFLIACSQWEYIYELIWKDINSCTNKPFVEKMKDADGEIVGNNKIDKNLIQPLNSAGHTQMVDLINKLEKDYRNMRHIMVHGFYHVHNGDKLISRLSNKSDEVIGDELIPANLLKAAEDIHQKVTELNSLRRGAYHKGADIFKAGDYPLDVCGYICHT